MSSIINEMVNQMTLQIERGVSIEINVFLREQEGVESYSISATEYGVYDIEIKVDDFSLQHVKQLFNDFTRFIELSYRTYYERRVGESNIVYDFISTDNNGIGFYCKIKYE